MAAAFLAKTDGSQLGGTDRQHAEDKVMCAKFNQERPILFSAPMILAILNGRKTQTRRVVKPQGAILTDEMARNFGVRPPEKQNQPVINCPYGQPGDMLWVRETWNHSNFPLGPYDENCEVFYRADYFDDPLGPDLELSQDGIRRKWRPSIHMPRSASRITLEITAVRVERLHEISIQDAKQEGIEGQSDTGPWRNYLRRGYWHPEGKDTAPICSYQSLWESINGESSWEANPWVWVIRFEVNQK